MEIKFHPKAKKEYDKLDNEIRKKFDAALKKISEDYTQIPLSKKLSGDLKDCYKIKLKSSGYRMIYEVINGHLLIYVLSVGKRDKSYAYKEASQRRNRKFDWN